VTGFYLRPGEKSDDLLLRRLVSDRKHISQQGSGHDKAPFVSQVRRRLAAFRLACLRLVAG
jgi:hypothetical protein